jgi:hypothetical protein
MGKGRLRTQQNTAGNGGGVIAPTTTDSYDEAPAAQVPGLCKKCSAAFGGRIKFFSALFSLILRSKISENRALKMFFGGLRR